MKLLPLGAALCLTAAAGLAAAQDDPQLARNLAATCTGCHGTNGRALAGSGMEPLAGVEPEKIVQKVRDFKAGAKPATVMQQIAKGYSDAQIELIARYFAAQK